MQQMSRPAPTPPADQDIDREWLDLGDILRLFQRHLKLVLAITTLCTAAAIGTALVLPRTYDAVSRVRIDPQVKAVLDTSITSQNFQTDQARVDTEIQLMRSLDIAEAVVRKLRLWDDPRYKPDADDSETPAAPGSPLNIRQIARGVGKSFEVRRNGNAFIVDLVFTADDPVEAARISNAFAQAYVDASGQLQAKQARDQSVYLERQMGKLGTTVRNADSKIAAYRANAGITQGGTGGTVTDQQIGPVSSEYAVAQSAAAEANGRLAAAQAQVRSGSLYAVSDVLNSTVIGQLRAQRADLLKSKAELDNRYGPNHPETRRVAGQLASVDDLIRDEADRIVSRLQADAQAANARAGSLGSRLSSLGGQQASNTRAAVTADSLQRENDANRQIYEKLAQQAQQTGQQAQVLQPAGEIVQLAAPPQEPTFPNRKLFALAGFLAGLMLGSATAIVIDYLRRGVCTPKELAPLGIPFISSLPLLPYRQRRALEREGRPLWEAVVDKPMSAFAEAIRTVRSIMMGVPRAGKGVVVSFISSLPGEGKSHTAVSLAQICATGGDRTIIVDCDLRRPTLVRLFDAPPTNGLIEVLTKGAPIDSAVLVRKDTGLHVLPSLQAEFSPFDPVGAPNFQQLIEALRDQYDVVVLDVPPVLAVASVRSVVRLCDTVYYLVKWDSTPRGAVKAGIRLLKQAGVPLAGALLNMVDTKKQAYMSEDDPAYYQKAYASYYQE